MIKTLILQFNIIKIRVVDPFLRIIHSGVSRWQWLRDMATDGPKIPSDKVDVILTVEDGDYPSGCSWIVWDDRCSRETNGGLLVQRQFSSFLERGRLFTRQEVRSLEIGPDKLCFTGDGTGFPNVWKSLDEPKGQVQLLCFWFLLSKSFYCRCTPLSDPSALLWFVSFPAEITQRAS
ncbi:hypothetical protein Ahy_B03g063416 isoform H [Arachis hypogaea]|uniref:Uncharacterized protein n=1 Tax=Arachis hypogaea TaxID=3818 RepID=A0A444ZX88_ARAHY|nr:hypothetical protein Ahy_B03g063416 isoform H [Arachis hypogaea]